MSTPVMGILTSGSQGAAPRAPYWPQRSTFRELVVQGKKLGMLVYVFSHHDVNWARGRVRGYSCTTRGDGSVHWYRGSFPLPDVVYNRVPSRLAEGHPAIQRCLRRFSARTNGRVFNPFYLNKWNVYRCLREDPELAGFLPATRHVRGPSDVRAILHNHGRIYLKPAGGSLGNYTMEVTPARSGRFRYRYNLRRGRTRTGSAQDWPSLWTDLRTLMGNRRYIVQQAIPLARVRGRRFDLRALVQKDSQLGWEMTGAAARVAGPGQITTHVPRGGRRAAMRNVLEQAFGEARVDEITGRLARLTVHAARTLEAGLGENFAEFSLDVGVDTAGGLWIFEINSKPLRFDEPRIQLQATRRLLEYARSLIPEAQSAGA